MKTAELTTEEQRQQLAKDKAREMVLEYMSFVNDYTTLSRPDQPISIVIEEGQKIGRAIQCALITVKFLIEEENMWQNGEVNPVSFWRLVKHTLLNYQH